MLRHQGGVCSMAASARHGFGGAKIFLAAFLALLLPGARIQPASAPHLSSGSTLLVTELPGSKTLADVISLSAGLQSTAGEVAGSLGLTGRPRFTAYGLQSGNTNITMMVDGFQIIANYPVPDTGATDEVDVKTFGNTADIREMGPAMNL